MNVHILQTLKRLTAQLAVLALVSTIYLVGGLEFLEFRFMDARFSIVQAFLHEDMSSEESASDLILVEIDPMSIQELGAWPWPRSVHGVLVERLIAAGVKRIAFDIDFSSEGSPDGDLYFERALAKSQGRVILAAHEQKVQADEEAFMLTGPLPRFSQHTEIASINILPESDGLVRRMETAYAWSDGDILTMSTMLKDMRSLEQGSFWIDYGIRPSSIKRVSYADILFDRFDLTTLADKKILIGATAIELGDIIPVPIMRSMPGPLLQAMSSQTADGGELQRLDKAPVLAVTLIIALMLARLFVDMSWRHSLIVLVAVSAATFLISLAAQVENRIIIDVVPLILASLLIYATTLIRRIDQQSLRLLLQSVDIRRRDIMMRNIVDNSFDGIITMNEDGEIEVVNPAFERMFGYPADEIVGRPITTLLSHLDLDEERDLEKEGGFLKSLLVQHGHREVEGRHKTGKQFPLEVTLNSMETDGPPRITAILRDITIRKKQEKALSHQALHDALTNLPNRTLLFDRLQHGILAAKREDKQMAVLLLDLDRFKDVNDTLGHHVGDNLLKEIADRLRSSVRESDTVARLGGDEFAILLPEIGSLKAAQRISDKIRERLEDPFKLQGLTLEIGGSIGIAMFPEHGDDAANLIQRADVAMYAAKEDQSGHAVYDPKTDSHSVRQLTLSGDLRRAITGQQLELHYQPKIDLKSNRICAVEALVRWHHPEHGFLPPNDFIYIAESTGLIGPLTLWVLRTALKCCADWHDRGINVDVAVNLSARQLQDQNLPQVIDEIIKEANIAPQHLILEVTESAIMVDPTNAMKVIMGLHALNVQLSIDDFGTGYSSLAYLRDLPANELKIDKSFVLEMTEDESNRKIVHSTINLAHNLGLKVVAEGVENDNIRKMLADMGCDVAQGFYFSRPVDIKKLEEWLTESQWGLKGKPADLSVATAPASA